MKNIKEIIYTGEGPEADLAFMIHLGLAPKKARCTIPPTQNLAGKIVYFSWHANQDSQGTILPLLTSKHPIPELWDALPEGWEWGDILHIMQGSIDLHGKVTPVWKPWARSIPPKAWMGVSGTHKSLHRAMALCIVEAVESNSKPLSNPSAQASPFA